MAKRFTAKKEAKLQLVRNTRLGFCGLATETVHYIVPLRDFVCVYVLIESGRMDGRTDTSCELFNSLLESFHFNFSKIMNRSLVQEIWRTSGFT